MRRLRSLKQCDHGMGQCVGINTACRQLLGAKAVSSAGLGATGPSSRWRTSRVGRGMGSDRAAGEAQLWCK